MTAQRRRLALVAGLVLVVAAFAWSMRWGSQMDSDPPPQATEAPGVFFTRPSLVGMVGGERQWDLRAGSMREQGDEVHLQDIEPGTLYRDGSPYLTFRADSGVWMRPSEDLYLRGNVQVFREGEPLLISDELIWRAADELLLSPGRVELFDGDDTIRADRMEGYVPRDEVVLEGNVELLSARGVALSMPGRMVYQLEAGTMVGFGRGEVRVELRREAQ